MKKLLQIPIIMGVMALTCVFVFAQAGNTDQLKITDFVRQLFIHGVPYVETSKYDASNIDTLLDMLNYPNEESYTQGNVGVMLGIIGDDRAVIPMIKFIEKEFIGDVAADTYRSKTATLAAMGYLVNRTNNEEALNYLIESIDPEIWAKRLPAGKASFQASQTQRNRDLSKFAIFGLAFSGKPSSAGIDGRVVI